MLHPMSNWHHIKYSVASVVCHCMCGTCVASMVVNINCSILTSQATPCLLHIRSLCYTGTIPSTWAAAGAFPALLVLQVTGAPIHGTLPVSWGSNGSFQSLEDLEVNGLSGNLPPEWGTPTAFQQLSVLALLNCNLTGMTAVLHTSGFMPSMQFADCTCLMSMLQF